MLQRKAQVAPNSSGLPKRFAAILAAISALASSRLISLFFINKFVIKTCRSVSNLSGRRLFMVTLSTATCFDNPLDTAVRPALAAVESPMSGFGDLTVARADTGAASNNIRAIWAGGSAPGKSDVIDYVTIGVASDASDFDELSVITHGGAGVAGS